MRLLKISKLSKLGLLSFLLISSAFSAEKDISTNLNNSIKSSSSSLKFNNILVQVLGAPASGKSSALNNIISSLSDQELKNKFENIKSVDLDIERENIANLPGDTQLYLMFKALTLFKDASKTSSWTNYHLNEIIKFVNNKLKTLYAQQGVDISYDTTSNSLTINSQKIDEHNFGQISDAIKDKSEIVFKQLGPWDLLIHLNRYSQILTMMESMYLFNNIQLDEVGTFSAPILERIKRFRTQEYATMTVLIHPKTVGVNLLLNALRAAKGNHLADPDYLYNQYTSLQKIISNKTDYFEKAENVITVSNENDFQNLQQQIESISIDDNQSPQNINKSLDLLIVINTLSINNILDSLIKSNNEDLFKKTIAVLQGSIRLIKTKFSNSAAEMDAIENILKTYNIFLTEEKVGNILKEIALQNKYIKESELYKTYINNQDKGNKIPNNSIVDKLNTSDCSKLPPMKKKECEWYQKIKKNGK